MAGAATVAAADAATGVLHAVIDPQRYDSRDFYAPGPRWIGRSARLRPRRGLQQALSEGNAKEFRRSAHSLKANAATVGADDLAKTFQMLESLGDSGDLNAATDKAASAEQAYRNLIEAIKKLRKQYAFTERIFIGPT